MKIIFLDIDGVLNSEKYDRNRTEEQGNIDKTRLPPLKKLVDETGALIVLSSSWRKHWEKDKDKCDDIGRELINDFAKYDLFIYDKTTCTVKNDRAEEIRMWLANNDNIEAFIIIDDIAFGWGSDLQDHLIRTNSRIGFGLEEKHIQMAIQLLKCE